MRDYTELPNILRKCSQTGTCALCDHVNVCLEKGCAIERSADAIEELLAAVPHWISVEDELPENHKNVLCCGAKGGMFVGWVSGIATVSNGKTIAFAHGGEGRCITHWMPLPESPKEVE